MSSVLPPESPSSRTWWTLSSKTPGQDSRKHSSAEKRSSGLKVIASAIGFKAKKLPSPSTSNPPKYAALPRISTQPIVKEIPLEWSPSRSQSSTRTRVDSLEPRTPSDVQRDGRPSLLTLSDADPFAVRGLAIPTSPSDPNHSLYLDSDVHSKQREIPVFNPIYNPSYPSRRSSEISPISPIETAPKKLKPRKSAGSLQLKSGLMVSRGRPDGHFGTMGHVSSNGVVPSAPFMDQDHPRCTQVSRVQTRPRGMTDAGVMQQGISGRNASTPFRVIIRQPSASRIGLPPSAPPMQDLPPPPHALDSPLEARTSNVSSVSSPNLSFASLGSSARHIESSSSANYGDIEVPPSGSPRQHQLSSTPSSLRKALSQQSLGKRCPSISNSAQFPGPDSTPPHKRSFNQEKQSFSLSNHNSSAISTLHEVPMSEQRRGSAGLISLPSISSKKRLFCGGSSTSPPSQAAASEDDARSVVSFRFEPNQMGGSSIFKPWIPPLSPALSPMAMSPASPTSVISLRSEDFQHELSSSPSSKGEYMPQQILSPDEMAELEASVEESRSSERAPDIPVLSPTMFIKGERDREVGYISPKPPLWKSSASASALPTRSNSVLSKPPTTPVPSHNVRPSTAQGGTAVPFTAIAKLSHPPPSTLMTSLPPPPRKPLSRSIFVTTTIPDDYGIVPLPPPPRKHLVRAIPSVERCLDRRSLIRKSSFLEIDDDSEDADTDLDSIGDPIGGSFLDLARESFDTSRNEEV